MSTVRLYQSTSQPILYHRDMTWSGGGWSHGEGAGIGTVMRGPEVVHLEYVHRDPFSYILHIVHELIDHPGTSQPGWHVPGVLFVIYPNICAPLNGLRSGPCGLDCFQLSFLGTKLPLYYVLGRDNLHPFSDSLLTCFINHDMADLSTNTHQVCFTIIQCHPFLSYHSLVLYSIFYQMQIYRESVSVWVFIGINSHY